MLCEDLTDELLYDLGHPLLQDQARPLLKGAKHGGNCHRSSRRRPSLKPFKLGITALLVAMRRMSLTLPYTLQHKAHQTQTRFLGLGPLLKEIGLVQDASQVYLKYRTSSSGQLFCCWASADDMGNSPLLHNRLPKISFPEAFKCELCAHNVLQRNTVLT